jgi:hypothetical protein
MYINYHKSAITLVVTRFVISCEIEIFLGKNTVSMCMGNLYNIDCNVILYLFLFLYLLKKKEEEACIDLCICNCLFVSFIFFFFFLTWCVCMC